MYIMTPPGEISGKTFYRQNTYNNANLLIAESHLKYGFTLKEIAGLHGIHYSTVSKTVAVIMEW